VTGLGLASTGSSLTLTDNLVRDIGGSTGSTDFDVYVSATLTQGTTPQVAGFGLVVDIKGRNTDGNILESAVKAVAIAP